MMHAEPSASSLQEWHYVILGEKETDFAGGVYHGTISFPPDYPFSPPSIRMYTPSGRFIPGKSICLSMTSFHPESWSPSWSISTILLGFQSYFYSNDHGIGALCSTPAHEIRRLASESMAYNKRDSDFRSLFPYLLSSGDATKSRETCSPSLTKRQAEQIPVVDKSQEKRASQNKKFKKTASSGVDVCEIIDVADADQGLEEVSQSLKSSVVIDLTAD
jgi:ubiquitin-conjugating enzyme E2 J2